MLKLFLKQNAGDRCYPYSYFPNLKYPSAKLSKNICILAELCKLLYTLFVEIKIIRNIIASLLILRYTVSKLPKQLQKVYEALCK